MIDKLTSLRELTRVVADTGNIIDIKKYKPEDATTNPSLILNAIKIPEYKKLINETIKWANKSSISDKQKIANACDKLVVNIGTEILKYIPGKISTEIDARFSYDEDGCIKKARRIMELYNNLGINNDRILIKLAATWPGIRAAEKLEKENIHCNITLLFSFAQARAAAEAGVYLISPFVGRILDWYKEHVYQKGTELKEDPGVIFVKNVYTYYKKHGYKTIVMGASFRNINEILQLAGCDCLTIAPKLLKELSEIEGTVVPQLKFNGQVSDLPKSMTEKEFYWEHHFDAMASEKLADGIRKFAIDQEKLEKILAQVI
ncbi:transaldolase [Arsenophonus symbiont of Ornithomya chloropus]|uniref:transaldolase n=1 Tax=Arsenophonus symbiont of Ornithomya chloropus TaxID=634121 RepID=UPI0032B22967